MKVVAASLICLLIPVTAWAEWTGRGLGGDTLEVSQCDPWPCIYYYNHEEGLSNTDMHTLTVNGMVIDVHITIEPKHSYESIKVVPRDPQVRAEPEQVNVEDGEDTYIDIILPLY